MRLPGRADSESNEPGRGRAVSAANTAESADFRGPLDITRAATAVLDAESTVIGWSPAAAELLGYGPAEALGRPLSAFLSVHPVGGAPPSGSKRSQRPTRRGARNDRGSRTTATDIGPPSLVGNEIHVAHARDGRELLVATAMCPLPGGAADRGPGAPDRILVAAEVGELRHWESRLALLQGLATQSPVGLAIYDTDLRLTWCNTAYEREIRAAAGRVPGHAGRRTVRRRLVRDSGLPADARRRHAPGARHGEPVLDLNFRAQQPSDPGRDHLWSCAYYRLEDAHGHVFGVCEDAFDITDRYRVQERLTLLVEAGRRIGTVLDVATTAEEIAEVAVPDFAATVRVDVTRAAVTGETAAVGSPADMSLLRVADRSEPGTATPDPAFPDPGPWPGRPGHRTAGFRRRGVGPPDAEGAESGPPCESGAANPGDDERHPYPPVAYPPGSAPQPLLRRARARRGHPGRPPAGRGRHPRARHLRPERRARRLGRPPAPDRATTFDNGEVALADELAARAAVCIDNARRYTRERTASLALQRQLLPHHLPPQSAVRTAYRYLPADDVTGVGGDWFDVIPLSGTRVGLVVGDVVGHGLQAAATMGRLRTSVRAFAQLDMPPTSC